MAQAGWFYASAGRQSGPVSDDALRGRLTSGNVKWDDLVWCEGRANWALARSVAALAQGAPPPLPRPSIPVGYAAPPPRSQDIGQDTGMRMLLPVGRSGWAIAAGYLGLLSVLLIFAPIALIVAIIAILDIKRNPQKHGMGRAVFGLITGVLGTTMLVLLFIGRAF